MGNEPGAEHEPEESGLPENFLQNEGRQAIHKAAYTSNATLGFFLNSVTPEYPEDTKDLLSRRDSLQALPFHHAIAGGQLDAVKTLLPLYIKHGLFPGAGVVNEAMRGGISPLEIAIKKGHIDIASFLLQNGASVRNSPGLSSPMHWIAEVGGRFLNMGALELIDDLVRRGADINQLDEQGMLPLQVALAVEDLGDALQKQQEELVLHLLSQPNVRVDPTSIIPETGRTLFHFVCSGGMPRVLEKMIALDKSLLTARHTKNQSALHLAVDSNSLAAVKVLLQAGAPVDLTSDDGATPLTLAIRMGEPEIARALLAAHANPNHLTSRGPLLFEAVSLGESARSIVSLLLEHGANPNSTFQGNSALHKIATELHDATVASLLIEKGADVDAQDSRGFTPLYIAAGTRDGGPLVTLLLQKGAKQTVLTPGGATPLHAAAHKGNLEIMAALIDAGAEINARTTSGKTPLSLAASQKKNEAAAMLLLKGATD